jgi:AcrR family transcriptional regulator
MPRTLNPIAHAVRRDTFLDAAQTLVVTKGYELLSIQDVLEAVGASKGAFYHYFDSKSALLAGVIDRMVEGALAAVEPAIDDPALSAPRKLSAFGAGLAAFKGERRDFLQALVQVWLSEENAVVRERFKRQVIRRLAPLMTSIIGQGVAEGSFNVTDVEATGSVFTTLLIGMNEAATELYLARRAGTVAFGEVERRFEAYGEALGRILGAAPGVVVLGDPAVIREWYADPSMAADAPAASVA